MVTIKRPTRSYSNLSPKAICISCGPNASTARATTPVKPATASKTKRIEL